PTRKSSTVARPRWIFNTNALPVFVGSGTRHTLASYVSRHTVPATTASGAHRLTGAAGKPAATAVAAAIDSPDATAAAVTMVRCMISMRVLLSLPKGLTSTEEVDEDRRAKRRNDADGQRRGRASTAADS